MNDHETTDDPMEFLDGLDARMEAVCLECEWCTPYPQVLPASGKSYVVGLTHQPGCPDFVDDESARVAQPCIHTRTTDRLVTACRTAASPLPYAVKMVKLG
jgi:hypothetical protein